MNHGKNIYEIQSSTNDKFIKKYKDFNHDDEGQVEKNLNEDIYLPAVVQYNNLYKLIEVSDKNDFERLLENKQRGLKYPVKLKKKIKVAIGGPYGFENLLS